MRFGKTRILQAGHAETLNNRVMVGREVAQALPKISSYIATLTCCSQCLSWRDVGILLSGIYSSPVFRLKRGCRNKIFQISTESAHAPALSKVKIKMEERITTITFGYPGVIRQLQGRHPRRLLRRHVQVPHPRHYRKPCKGHCPAGPQTARHRRNPLELVRVFRFQPI